MRVSDYYRSILVPANVAVSALRRAGLPVDINRVRQLREAWTKEATELIAYVEGESAKTGVQIKYSDKLSVPAAQLARFLYSPEGLGLDCYGQSNGGQDSTADEFLMPYASLSVPREDDHPVVKAILQIRSLSKNISTWLDCLERTRRADGACHPKFNWALRTARISAEDPPVHQIPERADKRIADGIKSCFVPRMNPAPNPDEWDPRKHGFCFRWDISGAEACWRAAALTKRFLSRPDPVAYDYLRFGKDIHSKTASLIYNVPEGTYKKGTYERDAVGKQTFFAKQYGAKWRTVQKSVWRKARYWLDDAKAQEINRNFDKGYVGLTELYLFDQDLLGKQGYCEDGYGRRRRIDIPARVTYLGDNYWDIDGLRWHPKDEEPVRGHRRALIAELEHCFHVMANTPTQSMNATDNLFMLALAYHGEIVDLRVPPMWEKDGVLFPEAKEWRLHEGPGPGGKPFLAWHNNTVHDSGWGDGAPGYLEPVAKLIGRRCHSVPMDWRLEADVPYRVDLSVGPDMSRLSDYNKVAAKFGLEPLPKR